MQQAPVFSPDTNNNPYKIENEAAEYVRLSPRTLQRHRQQGTGPLFTKAGHRVLYRQSDLDDWLTGNVFRSTSEAGASGKYPKQIKKSRAFDNGKACSSTG